MNAANGGVGQMRLVSVTVTSYCVQRDKGGGWIRLHDSVQLAMHGTRYHVPPGVPSMDEFRLYARSLNFRGGERAHGAPLWGQRRPYGGLSEARHDHSRSRPGEIPGDGAA